MKKKKKNGPKVKKSQEGNPRERIYFETKYTDSLQPEGTIQIGAKGRSEILPFHSQNCPLADKIAGASSSKSGTPSQHCKRNGGQREAKWWGATCF